MGYLEAVRGLSPLHAENRSNQNKLYIHRLWTLTHKWTALDLLGGGGLVEAPASIELAKARTIKTRHSAKDIFKINKFCILSLLLYKK